MAKWVAALLGYVIFRFPGALLGFLLGSFLDQFNVPETAAKSPSSQKKNEVSPADFELNLLSLCAIVIKADGTINRVELDYVRQYFVNTYGKEKANAIFRTFNEVIKQREVSARRICTYMNQRTRYEVRLQLLHFLFGIANSDGEITSAEIKAIREIGSALHVNYRDFESIMAMFVKAVDTPYKILEIEKNATNDEIKKAYREMAKKYHPDKVVTNDEAIKKGAEEKFKEVQKAYEQLQKERGF